MSTFLLALLLQIAAPVPQPTTVNPADLCTIQGVVVKAGTGEPLRKAVVNAVPAGGRNSNRDQPQGGWTVTDEMGRFEIKDLSPGRYYLAASRTGFVRQSYGARTPQGRGTMLTLSAGQRLPDLTFQMIPAAAITGHVYDDDGDPVQGAQVSAMHYAYINGQRLLATNSVVMANDLGEFRLYGIAPGQYFVQSAFPNYAMGNNKTQPSYLPVFYPGGTDVSHATPINLRGGDEYSGVNINLQAARSVSIKGAIVNVGCGDIIGRGAVVFIANQNSNQNAFRERATPITHEQGAFEFSNVAPGSYYIYGQFSEGEKQCFGRQPVEVTDSDISGVLLTLNGKVDISGHIRVEGQLDARVAAINVSFVPKDMIIRFGAPASGASKADGSFTIRNAYDGDYDVMVGGLPDNYFVKSARLDGVDVLNSGLTIDTRQAPGSLEIVVSPNGASVDGAVSKDNQPFQGATVALVPDPPHRGERRLYNSTTTDQNGHFILQGPSPGDYKVFAWEKIEPGAYSSPEFLQDYEKQGESVHITEGSHSSVQVDLIPAPDANP